MRKDRLERLLSRMQKVKPEHFNIAHWYSVEPIVGMGPSATLPEFTKTDVVNGKTVLLKEGFCGSSACVLGTAALIPEFNDAGLYVDITNIGGWYHEGLVVYKDPVTGVIHDDIYGGALFFDIPKNHAEVLFGIAGDFETFYGNPREDIGPEDVVKALREYIDTDGASIEPYLFGYDRGSFEQEFDMSGGDDL